VFENVNNGHFNLTQNSDVHWLGHVARNGN